MKIELYQIAKTQKVSYQPLTTIDSECAPVKGTFIFYNSQYFEIINVVIATNRIVAFVKSNDREMGFENHF